jgi:putative phosphoesterase
MKVALMANTHDRLPVIRALLARLQEKGISLVLHAGDYVAPWSLGPFREAGMALLGVFGHNDGDHQGLLNAAQQGVGHEIYESPHLFRVGTHQVLIVHDLADMPERALSEHEIVLHGTKHETEVRQVGDSLVVCPGEACGWLTGKATCAILDLETKEIEFISLSEEELKA